MGGAQLANPLGVSAARVRELLGEDPLRAFVYLDQEGRVLGFGGLAAAPMHHQLEVKGRTLWAWCAWDTLFLPAVLDETARVSSPDPETGRIVRLTVSPRAIEAAEPEDAVVSFLLPEAGDFGKSAANVMANFCHFVFFFTSRESGERWAAQHEGTFLYWLEEAFDLSRRLTSKQFGRELARRRQDL